MNQSVLNKIAKKRFSRTLEGKRKLRERRRFIAEANFNKNRKARETFSSSFTNIPTYEELLDRWLPTNLRYLLQCSESDFELLNAKNETWFPKKKPIVKSKILMVPKEFSLIYNPKESFEFIRRTTMYCLFGDFEKIDFSYEECERLDIGAQVLLDIVLRDVIAFSNKCSRIDTTRSIAKVPGEMGLTNLMKTSTEIKKVLFSVGSPAVHTGVNFRAPDIIPYKLCVHSPAMSGDRLKAMEQKDIDTTQLAEYVIDSLARVGKRLSPEKLEDLCTIIGEVLINAEEHSTTSHRFSIGYYQDLNENGKHIGLFRLVILNLGKTIYEKFKDPDCPNKAIVSKMRDLSKRYTKSNWFSDTEFKEETLWTLYALQEGVTSVLDKKRGNGSIQFIDSFFNIKGDPLLVDEKSRMTILSGNTNITFDGTFRIMEKSVDRDTFKVMTFNESGNIEERPSKDYVKSVGNYFPGTVISARIYFHEDDLTENA